MPKRIPTEILKHYKDIEVLAHTFSYQAEDLDLSAPHKPFADEISFAVERGVAPFNGLVFYILSPTHPSDNEIKILFRGTRCFGSILRDLEAYAPGHYTFQNSLPHLLSAFSKALQATCKSHNTVSVSICGHSLGAADAQNFCAALVRNIKLCHELDGDHVDSDDAAAYKKIKTLRLSGFNAPGITHAVAQAALTDLKILRQHDLLNVECYWLLAGGDLVQQVGQTMLFATASAGLAKIHMIKAIYREKIWQNFYSVMQLMSAINNSVVVHKRHYFKNNDSECKYHYYTNEYAAEADIIRDKLARKTQLLNTPLGYYGQMGLSFLLQLTYRAWRGAYAYNKDFNDRVGIDFEWVIVSQPFSHQSTFIPSQLLLTFSPSVSIPNSMPLFAMQIFNQLHAPVSEQKYELLLIEYRRQPVFKKPEIVVANNLNKLRHRDALFYNRPHQRRYWQDELEIITEEKPFKISDETRKKLIQSLDKYILNRNKNVDSVNLNFKTLFFRKTSLTTAKVSEAIALRKFLLSNDNDLDVLTNIKQLKVFNRALEASAHKKYFVTKSDFEQCLNNLDEILAARHSDRPNQRLR